MGLPEELYCAMLEVGHCTRRHKISGPLAHTMIDIAQKSLELWRRDEKTAMRFAAGMLAGPTNFRATTGQLPEPVASACWRLIGLLEYHSSNATSRQPPGENILQPPRLLEGARSHREAGVCSQGDWTAGQGLAQKAGYLADLSACTTARTVAEVWRGGAKRSTPGDLLFLPHDRVGRKTFRYALTVVDVASRYKEAEPLTSKTAAEVADALSRIYRRGPLKWSKLLQVDPGREFMGSVSQLLAKYSVQVRRGRVDIHRNQGVVERWNRTLAERLFGHQYAQEMRLPSGQRSTEWVARLPGVVAALNGEVIRLTGKRPSDAIKLRRSTHALLCSSWPPYWSQGAEAPFGCWGSLPLPARRTGGRSAPRHRPCVVSWGVPAGTLSDQARWACIVLPAE